MKRNKGRREGVLIALRRVRRPLAILSLALTFVWLTPLESEAKIAATTPLTESNGTFACPTCLTETGGPNAVTLTDLPTDTAANWAAKIGTPTGTGEFVRAITPSFTGTPNFSGITPPLVFPADTFDDLADFKSTIKQGTGATKFATTAGGSTTTGKQVQFDANGNLEASASDIGGGSSIVQTIDFSPMTSLSITDATDVFCGFDGSCSTTANGADVQSTFDATGTFAGISCKATGTTGTAITVDLDFGTCGGALSTGTATAVMSTSAWTTPTTQSGTSAFTDEQCGVFKFSTTGADATANLIIRCTVRKTVGT